MLVVAFSWPITTGTVPIVRNAIHKCFRPILANGNRDRHFCGIAARIRMPRPAMMINIFGPS